LKRAFIAALPFAIACTSIIGLPDLPDAANGPDVGGDVVGEASSIDANGGDVVVVEGGDASSDAGPQPVAIVTGQTSIHDLTVTGGNVYFTIHAQPGQVRSCPTSGCGANPTLFAGLQDYAYAITNDGTNVYWTCNGGNVMKCATTCTTPVILASGQGGQGIAVDTSTVYWTNGGSSAPVMKCAKAGCSKTPTTITTGQGYPAGIVSDGTIVAWANGDGSIKTCPANFTCTTPSVIATTQQSPWGIAMDSNYIYWTNDVPNGTVMRCPKSGSCPNPTVLASNQQYPAGITTDGVDVYWANGGGTIMKCSTGGCNSQPTTLATGQLQASGIAIDATTVYWTTQDAVMKLTPR